MKPLFCFHGYGETAETFAMLENRLGADYTIIALDMPFHGQTQWHEGLLFTGEDLLEIMGKIQHLCRPPSTPPSPKGGDKTNNPALQAIDNNNNIKDGSSLPPFRGWGHGPGLDTGFSLLGYSMGGRIALHLLQTKPELVERIVLVAPDGLHKNKWYRFATQNLLGNRLFKYAMYRPQGAFRFIGLVAKVRLVHPGMMKIVRFYTDDELERQRLYCRWTTMRKFKPKMVLVKKNIQQYGVPVRFLFGRFDNIILSSRAEVFKHETNVQVHIIDAGHRLMQEKYAPVISTLFYQ